MTKSLIIIRNTEYHPDRTFFYPGISATLFLYPSSEIKIEIVVNAEEVRFLAIKIVANQVAIFDQNGNKKKRFGSNSGFKIRYVFMKK